MGINAKGADKRQFQQKQLLAEIQTRRTEQERQRAIPFSSVPNYQFEYTFTDSDIVVDVARLLLAHIAHSHQSSDKSKLEIFVKEFIPTFFGIPSERLDENGDSTSRRSPVDEEMEDATDTANAQGRQAGSKKSDLLRDVLERGRTGRQGRTDHGSAASDSKESTPDVGTLPTDETSGAMETDDQDRSVQLQSDNWLRHPESAAALRTKPLARQIPPYEQYSRDIYSLYCNANVYTFVRLFQVLYDRLGLIKDSEQDVADDVRRAKMSKPARDLKMIPFAPETYFSNTGPHANYYRQVLDMCEEVLEGRLDMTHFEDALRHYYMQNGWKLYSIDKLVSAIVRTAGNIVNSELRDKSNELVQLFLKDREKPMTTHKDELTYRKQVEKLVKDGDGVFRIAYVSLVLPLLEPF
jgi:paired amphipathic helix protein Sin3a